MQDLDTEYTRALSNTKTGASMADGFGQEMRTGVRSNYKDGDILCIPSLHVDSVEEDGKLVEKLFNADNKKVVVQQKLMRNGVPTDKDLFFILIPAKRRREDGSYPSSPDVVVRCFGSLFNKRTIEYVKNDDGTFEKVGWVENSGDAIVFAKERFASVNRAFEGLSGKEILCSAREIYAIPYGGDEPEKDRIWTFTFHE